MKTKDLVIIIVVVLLLLFGVAYAISKIRQAEKKAAMLENNIAAISDTLKVVVNRDSSKTATIKAFEVANSKQLLQMESKDLQITDLRKLVERYKNRLEPGSTATQFSTEEKYNIKVPTVKDSILSETVFQNSTAYIPMEKFKWIGGRVFTTKDSTTLDLQINNKYDVVVGYENGKPFAEVTNYNPYSTFKTMRATTITAPSKKRVVVSGSVGYGAFYDNQSKNVKLGPGVTIGLGYKFFEI